MALILNRFPGRDRSSLWIGRDVLVTVDSVAPDGEVRLRVDAPSDTPIWRAELVERTLRETGRDLRDYRKGETVETV